MQDLIFYTLCVCVLSRVWCYVTPWTLAHQAPLSMEFSRQEYWSELPFPSPGDRPDLGIELRFPTLQAYSLPSEPPGKSISGVAWLHFEKQGLADKYQTPMYSV